MQTAVKVITKAYNKKAQAIVKFTVQVIVNSNIRGSDPQNIYDINVIYGTNDYVEEANAHAKLFGNIEING